MTKRVSQYTLLIFSHLLLVQMPFHLLAFVMVHLFSSLQIPAVYSQSLTFSLGLVDYHVFKSNMDTAVLNAYEFGQV